MADTIQHSPLADLHLELGGRMVDFAGWNMPVMYSSILDEHSAVRRACGIFDISHMGQFVVLGGGAGGFLNRMLTNDIRKLGDGEGQYTLMLNEAGGVIDDLIVYRVTEEEYFLVVNASVIAEDFAWLDKHRDGGVTLTDESPLWAGMAVQGPDAAEVFSKVFPAESLPPRNGISNFADGMIVCRTGYTGEDGFELFCPAAEGTKVFRAFIEAGAKPCGLGARDSLRLEVGYPLNGSDLSPERTPVEAGLGFFVALDKGEFVGREVVAKQKADRPEVKLAALEYTGKGAPPRSHYRVFSEAGEDLGELSSGVLSPTLGKGIAMAYLPLGFAKVGTPLEVDVRGRRFPAVVVKKPFYKSSPKKS